MAVLSIESTIIPINDQSKKIDERFYDDLVSKAFDSFSMAKVYMQFVPNVIAEPKIKPTSTRMARFRKAGLIGCLNDTGVTSANYKEIIYGSGDIDSKI